MPEEKRELILGAHRSTYDPRDYNVERIFKGISAMPLPENLDLRPGLFAVRDQGLLGSCVAQACATIKDFEEKKDPGSKISTPTCALFVYKQRFPKNIDGMQTRNAFNILYKQGICLSSDYFDDPANLNNPIPLYAFDSARRYPIEGYARINSIDGLRQSLYIYGPALMVINVYNYDATSMWRPGANDKLIGQHAIAVVGYDNDGFILRNSWGSLWGNKGDFHIPYDDFKYIRELWTIIDANSAKSYFDHLKWYDKVITTVWNFFTNLFKK